MVGILATPLANVPAWAGGISDCQSEYESEIERCKLLHGDDPDEAEDLQSCIENAKDEYESCQEECES